MFFFYFLVVVEHRQDQGGTWGSSDPLNDTCTNRQRTRIAFPAISRMLTQQLAATPSASHHPRAPSASVSTPPPFGPRPLHATIATLIRRFTTYDKHWNPTKHTTTIGHQLFVKIKSHQIRSNDFPKYHSQLRPCFALVHSNHCVDKTCELPYTDQTNIPFPLPCSLARITPPLYSHPINLYYGLYPVDMDVCNFFVSAYQAELLLCLATKPTMVWYARNIPELQSTNRTIGFTGPTCRLITHQTTNCTQQLYKDKHTRVAAQRYNHPDPYTPL